MTAKGVLLMTVMLLVMYSCKKEIFKLSTTSDVNITGYLEENPEQYSMLLQILEKSKTQGYLGAYGTYTLFAPTNAAIQTWLTENGKNSVADIADEDLLNFVKYHVIKDTVSTVRFADGKIRTPTLFGEYLYTDVSNGLYRVNKSATISKSNIVCGNGIIQSIDRVLVPPTKSLAQLIESKADRYSIFLEALKTTGFYDTLSYQRGDNVTPQKRFQTVIVQSDSLYATMGINSYQDLADKYSTKNDPQNHADSLWLYIAYHISNGANFVQDIGSAQSIYTLAPGEIVSTKLVNTQVLLNEAEFNGVLEPGAPLIRSYSDMQASNGVLHEARDNFYIKVRKQVPVYFDLADSPEMIAALGSAYHNAGLEIMTNGASIASSVIFEDPTKSQGSSYDYAPTPDARRPRANGDMLNLSFCNSSAARQKYVEFKTPYLVKGRYKVWLCYIQFNYGAHLQASYDPGTDHEQILPNIAYTTTDLGGLGISSTDLAGPNSDNLLLAQGYKRYMALKSETSRNGASGNKDANGNNGVSNVGRLMGVINVETTDRHIIRLTAIGEGRCATKNTWLDMLHFIPVDDNEQNYPRFSAKPGEIFDRP
ncbi:hypothetical protein BCY91_11385 [Pelobium manganitolerans]|uniref:FAS1 domain-containing protein n=2 Tax=Pelobium manganitolerans TaxID=1842495 RepID=A0A419S296_9SPHI|nr:hypothetical protein BCY91_11385 [Pelobium manganitolerans]